MRSGQDNWTIFSLYDAVSAKWCDKWLQLLPIIEYRIMGFRVALNEYHNVAERTVLLRRTSSWFIFCMHNSVIRLFFFSLWTICTYVLLCTYWLCYLIIIIVVCTVCTALLFSYSAIFIAASVRNKLIQVLIVLEHICDVSQIAKVRLAFCCRRLSIKEHSYYTWQLHHHPNSSLSFCNTSDIIIASKKEINKCMKVVTFFNTFQVVRFHSDLSDASVFECQNFLQCNRQLHLLRLSWRLIVSSILRDCTNNKLFTATVLMQMTTAQQSNTVSTYVSFNVSTAGEEMYNIYYAKYKISRHTLLKIY